MYCSPKKEYQGLFDPKVYMQKSLTLLLNGDISDEEYQVQYCVFGFALF